MADIYGGFDFLAAGNALSQMQSGRLAQENARLQQQYTMEDRARAAQERKAAAGNALAEQARKRELLEIYSNFGVTPAVTGQRGQSYSGTGVANDPYADIQNKLVRQGFASEAGNVAELQNKNLLGKKAAAETAGQEATTKGINIKNIDARLNLVKQFANSVTTPDSAANFALIMAKEFPEFASLYGSPEDAAARSAELFAKDPAAWQAHSVSLTGEQLVQATERAKEAKTAKPVELDLGGKKIFVDMNPNSPTFKQEVTGFDKTLTPAETATKTADAEKLAWERANPEYTLQETAQGLVAVNKRNPNNVKPVQLGGQTLMPADKRSVTNIQTFEPATETAQKEYVKDIATTRKELQTTIVVLDNIEKAKELIPEASSFMGAGGDAYLTAAKFLNNRFGSNIDVQGVKSAEELRSRLFMGVLDNLKKLDSQPTQQQQQALQEAFGRLETDPNALPQVLDVIGDALRTKVGLYNKDVTDAEARGVKFPFKPQIDLPPQKIIRENSFPNADAAGQILKQRGAKPGDRVRVNIGGQTGTFVVE
jgi:hypothetical protein